MTAPDDAVWERLRTMMPTHTCGRRMEPGGLGDTPTLVCLFCAYIEEVTPAWANDMAAAARAAIGDQP